MQKKKNQFFESFILVSPLNSAMNNILFYLLITHLFSFLISVASSAAWMNTGIFLELLENFSEICVRMDRSSGKVN